MIRVHVEELGHLAWLGRRKIVDPIQKILFGLLQQQTVNLRNGSGGPVLEKAMFSTARALCTHEDR
jgi:hypothetical protein